MTVRHLTVVLALALAAPVASARSLQVVLERVDMRDTRDGFAIRTFDGMVRSVARTRDGGRTFTDVASLDGLRLRGARAIAALDGRTVLVAGDGWVLRSTNGGRTFSRVDVPADLSYRKIALAGSTATGWLLGVRSDEDPRGALFLTLDAGRTFRARVSPREARFSDFSFLDPANGFAIDGGEVVRTRNGGASFEPVSGTPNGRYTAVAARDAVVLAAATHLAVSTDRGGRWREVPLPTDAVIRSVQVVAPRRWVVVAEGDIAWRSDDAGANWARLALAPGGGRPRFIDTRLAYAGGSPALYVSQDAGESWHPADPRYREEVDTETGALPPLLARDDENYEVSGEAPPPEERSSRSRRERGAAAASSDESSDTGAEDSAVLREAEERGVPQGALRRAQRAAERMRRRGQNRGSDWIKGVRRGRGRRP